jgi:hypothetical protein
VRSASHPPSTSDRPETSSFIIDLARRGVQRFGAADHVRFATVKFTDLTGSKPSAV